MKREKLRLKVLGKYGSLIEFGKAYGFTRQTASSIVGNGNLKMSTIIRVCEDLGIKRKDIGEYFFPVGVEIVKRVRK